MAHLTSAMEAGFGVTIPFASILTMSVMATMTVVITAMKAIVSTLFTISLVHLL